MRAWCETAIGLGAILLLGLPLPAGAVCGDGHVDGQEECDGADLGGKTCADLTSGFAQSGTLACKPDCTFDTTDCRRAFIESLLPANGGSRKNRCQLEWGTVGTAKGKRGTRVCSDGDPGCDQDHDFNNACTIRIQLCMDVPDPRMTGCKPAKIVRVDVLPPTLTAGADVLSAVLSAADHAAQDQAHLGNGTVTYAPPVTDFSCGSATVRVPLRGTTGSARPGTIRLRARTSDNSGLVRAIGTLALTCMP